MTTSALSGLRALVTGGAGFIGSRLCSRLRSLGADVYATTRASRASVDAQVHWLTADLAELEEIRAAFAAAQPEVVFHLAGHVSGGRTLELVEPTLRDNLISAVNLLTVAQEGSRPRVVLAGSMEEPSFDLPAGTPSSPYAVAKWAASAYSRMFHALYSLPVINLRIFMVYGPGQRDSTKLIPYVIRSMLRGDRPRLTSGTRAVDWVYVDDVVDAFVSAALAEKAEGRTVDIGSGTSVTVREVVERLAARVNVGVEPIFGAIPDRSLETSNVADIQRTEEILGWQPTTTLDDGLQMTVDWFMTESGVELDGAST